MNAAKNYLLVVDGVVLYADENLDVVKKKAAEYAYGRENYRNNLQAYS
jgi:hypothetical protein